MGLVYPKSTWFCFLIAYQYSYTYTQWIDFHASYLTLDLHVFTDTYYSPNKATGRIEWSHFPLHVEIVELALTVELNGKLCM